MFQNSALQVVPLVDSLYRPFFPNITFCSIAGNQAMVESLEEKGYRIITYTVPQTQDRGQIGDGWIAYR